MKTRNVLFELHTLPWSHLAAVRVFLNCMPGQANIVLVMNKAGSLREPECNISGQSSVGMDRNSDTGHRTWMYKSCS